MIENELVKENLLEAEEVLEIRPSDPECFKGICPFTIHSGSEFKKCCKKYKRGKRCKKCPNA